MEINEFLRLLEQALKTEGVKREILKIVNETDNNFVSRSESNKIEIAGNDNFFSQGMLLMQKGYDKLNIEIYNLENELNEKTNEIRDLKKDLDNSKQELEKLSFEKRELETIKNSEINSLNNKIEDFKKIIRKNENEIFELKDDKKELQEEINNLEIKLNRKENKIEELKEKNTKLNDEVKIKDEEIENLNSNMSHLTRDITNLENENDELNTRLVEYENNCKREIEIYNKFLSLSNDTKDSLKRTFKGDSLSDFISCGVQNIDNFWEYIKSEILENKNNDIEKLVEIFYFLFEKYRVSEDKFELLDTKEGDNFDTNLEIKHNESPKNSGIITKVYLKGYKNINKDKIIKQSIVKVG